MFGYVITNKQELKFREYDVYKSYYCGLCQELKKRHGLPGQLTLSYDMTFLVMLLTSLYEPQTYENDCKCIAHPLSKQHICTSIYSKYVSDMNILLSYYKCLDDWNDEKNLGKFAFSKLLKNGINKSSNTLLNTSGEVISPFISYEEKASKIEKLLETLRENEKNNVTDIDIMSGIFGNIMSVLFTPHDDEWSETLSRVGFFLGKFIYILDAYDDIEKDIKHNAYNPFKEIYSLPDFHNKIMDMLKMMMAECSKAFELLPILDNIEILRNILYAGVWQSNAFHKQ